MITLTAGQKYDIKLEYRQLFGYAYVKLRWASHSQVKQIIPQSQLRPDTIAPTATITPTATQAIVLIPGQSWTASTGFGSTQGLNQWFYMRSQSLVDFAQLVWNAGAGRWNPPSDLPLWIYVGNNWQDPDGNWAVRQFLVPAGVNKIRITGTAKDDGTTGFGCPGDGVVVVIHKNATRIWGWQYIGPGNLSGYSHDLTIDVVAGDKISFSVGQNSSWGCDKTYWDPTITSMLTATPSPTATATSTHTVTPLPATPTPTPTPLFNPPSGQVLKPALEGGASTQFDAPITRRGFYYYAGLPPRHGAPVHFGVTFMRGGSQRACPRSTEHRRKSVRRLCKGVAVRVQPAPTRIERRWSCRSSGEGGDPNPSANGVPAPARFEPRWVCRGEGPGFSTLGDHPSLSGAFSLRERACSSETLRTGLGSTSLTCPRSAERRCASARRKRKGVADAGGAKVAETRYPRREKHPPRAGMPWGESMPPGNMPWACPERISRASGRAKREMRGRRRSETRWASGYQPTDYLYTGQRAEAGIGLYYYNARWYDPSLGRFAQADTIISNPSSPIAFDRYGYVNNRPISNTDPSGHFSQEEISKMVGCRGNTENACFKKWYAGISKELWGALSTAELGDILSYMKDGRLQRFMFIDMQNGQIGMYNIHKRELWVSEGKQLWESDMTVLWDEIKGASTYSILKGSNDNGDYTFTSGLGAPALPKNWNRIKSINGEQTSSTIQYYSPISNSNLVGMIAEIVGFGTALLSGPVTWLGVIGLGAGGVGFMADTMPDGYLPYVQSPRCIGPIENMLMRDFSSSNRIDPLVLLWMTPGK